MQLGAGMTATMGFLCVEPGELLNNRPANRRGRLQGHQQPDHTTDRRAPLPTLDLTEVRAANAHLRSELVLCQTPFNP
jgi:hypothetical protein